MQLRNVFHYREIPPPADLDHLVLSFWEFTVDPEARGPIGHEIFPDGCISLLYRRNEPLKFTGLITTELHTRSVTVPVYGADIFWGTRLSPAAAARILGGDPGGMAKHLWSGVGAEHGLFDEALMMQLNDCVDLESAADIFAARLRTRGLRPEDIDEKVLAAVRLIERDAGEVRIAALAAAVNLSPRQFERRFKKSSGLSPKQYARNRRLRAAAAMLAGEEPVSWAERAAAMGFTDQAHLSHEVSTITGNSPRSLAKKVKKIDHGTLV